MSTRMAQKPVKIVPEVSLAFSNRKVEFSGPFGCLSQIFPKEVCFEVADGYIRFFPENDSREANIQLGTAVALFKNNMHGVTKKFEVKLALHGTGYRAKVESNVLHLTVGLSHPVTKNMPEGVAVQTLSQTEIVLSGIDKGLVSQTAAKIRAVRPPEPYGGKGIRYAGENIICKEVKKK